MSASNAPGFTIPRTQQQLGYMALRNIQIVDDKTKHTLHYTIIRPYHYRDEVHYTFTPSPIFDTTSYRSIAQK